MVSKQNFGKWLTQERDARGWSQADLARRSGLGRALICKAENGVSFPHFKTLLLFAAAFQYSPVYMFRVAGLLPEDSEDDARIANWRYLLSQLTPEEEEELRHLAEWKIERRQTTGKR